MLDFYVDLLARRFGNIDMMSAQSSHMRVEHYEAGRRVVQVMRSECEHVGFVNFLFYLLITTN